MKKKLSKKALTAQIMLGLLLAMPLGAAQAEQITGSITYDQDKIVDGGDTENALQLAGQNGVVIGVKNGGTLTLQNSMKDNSAVNVLESTVTFDCGKVTIANNASGFDPMDGIQGSMAVAHVNNGVMDFADAETVIQGSSQIGLQLFNFGMVKSDNKLTVNIDRTNEKGNANVTGIEINNSSNGNPPAGGDQLETNDLAVNVQTAADNTGTTTGLLFNKDTLADIKGQLDITAANGSDVRGIYAAGGFVELGDKDVNITTIAGENAKNTGILLNGDGTTSLSLNDRGGNMDINVIGGKEATGFYVGKNAMVMNEGHLKINVDSEGKGVGLHVADLTSNYMSGLKHSSTDITVKGDNGTAILTEGGSVNISGDVTVNAATAIHANGGMLNIGMLENSDFISTHEDSLIKAENMGNITIGSMYENTMQFTGRMEMGEYSTLNYNMNTADSYWKVTGDSNLSSLSNTKGTLDMTADKGKFSTVTVYSMVSDGGNISMDVNGSQSDKIYAKYYVTGDATININDLGGADATGTVLVSVGDVGNNAQATFKANDSEGALFWKKYELDKKENNGSTDWYISNIVNSDAPTTGAASVLSTNSLNYHTWRTENDQLLQRTGELRHNGEEEKGAWFRMHGSKIGRDGQFGFENKYTTYELGFDNVTKRTDDMVRYQGVALSYTDGSSGYGSGSGENHNKAIGFYSTDQYSKGHYLDVVFKISNLDNDFAVVDTNGKKITGEFDNTGIALSAEYGRKNDLRGGWYIEPQAQLTLGYLGGAEYESSNGITVEQSGIASAVGRVGFNIGKQIGERGIIYAKANLLHEFGGGYDVEMRHGADKLAVSDTFNDTWFEYGVGAAFATSKNSHVYFDVERSTGSDFYKDWEWNAGVRWSF